MSEELIQGSEEWLAARCGSFGASRLGDLLAKGGGKTRASYLLEIVAERLSGQPCGFEGNRDTDFGNEQEPHARKAYELHRGVFVEQVGLVVHPAMDFTHASPDGLVNEDGGCEIKSHRKPITHLKAIEGEIPKAHVYQCQWGMACTGRSWWDYANWCPFMPEHLRLNVRRVERDNKLIAELTVAITDAQNEVLAIMQRYAKKEAA